jgi:leucyl-tRNA synthetase
MGNALAEVVTPIREAVRILRRQGSRRGRRTLRGHIRMAIATGKDELEQLALANEKIKAFVEGKQIAKLVVVPCSCIS